jgi:hypothetical protein
MRGILSSCSICGIPGEKYGAPSFGDVCVDAHACRERVAYQLDSEIRRLKKELDNANNTCPFSILTQFSRWFEWHTAKYSSFTIIEL